MFQNILDFEKARELRDDGIKRAVDHADSLAPAVAPKWSDTAFDYLLEYARENRSFTSEDVRQAAERAERVTIPPDKRAWGGVVQRASRAGIIERAGFVTAKDPKVHCNNIALWRSRSYRPNSGIADGTNRTTSGAIGQP